MFHFLPKKCLKNEVFEVEVGNNFKIARKFQNLPKASFSILGYQDLQKNDLELPKNKNKIISF